LPLLLLHLYLYWFIIRTFYVHINILLALVLWVLNLESCIILWLSLLLLLLVFILIQRHELLIIESGIHHLLLLASFVLLFNHSLHSWLSQIWGWKWVNRFEVRIFRVLLSTLGVTIVRLECWLLLLFSNHTRFDLLLLLSILIVFYSDHLDTWHSSSRFKTAFSFWLLILRQSILRFKGMDR